MSYIWRIFVPLVNITFDDNLRCTCTHNIYVYWWYIFRISALVYDSQQNASVYGVLELHCPRHLWLYLFISTIHSHVLPQRLVYIKATNKTQDSTYRIYVLTARHNTHTACKHNLPNVNGQFHKQYWTRTPISYINEYTTTSTTTSNTYIDEYFTIQQYILLASLTGLLMINILWHFSLSVYDVKNVVHA